VRNEKELYRGFAGVRGGGRIFDLFGTSAGALQGNSFVGLERVERLHQTKIIGEIAQALRRIRPNPRGKTKEKKSSERKRSKEEKNISRQGKKTKLQELILEPPSPTTNL